MKGVDCGLETGTTYAVSETTLESQWIPGSWSDYEKCENCGFSLYNGHFDHGYECGRYCQRCGARMKNPHFHSIEIDWGDFL